MNKKMVNIILAVISVLMIILFTNVSMSSALIMMFGIRTMGTISIIFCVIFSLIAILNIISIIKYIAKQKAIKGETLKAVSIEKEVEEGYAQDAGNAFHTRKKLIQIETSSPGYSSLMEKCLAQMNRIDELQKRQKELITSNSAAYLNDTENTLNNVEREICLNFRGIVNQCIVAGDEGNEDSLDMDKVNIVLEKNNELLTQSKELLKVSADWIDEYNNKGEGDRSLLESWITTIKNTINKE